MRILNSQDSLRSYLLSQTGKSIKIVTAFAGGTESILSKLLEKNNIVELLVGTINAFTSPDFIKHCIEQKSSKLKAYVDFRYQESTHWKLYLVSPNIVVIGSSNFTVMGLSLVRDTCVIIEDLQLYSDYEKLVKKLLKSNSVILAKSTEIFNSAFEAYREIHDRSQAGMARSKRYPTVSDWLADETNQKLPLFIWDSLLTPDDKNEAKSLLQKNSDENDTPTLRDFFTLKALKEGFAYSPGDVVLCASRRGGHINFYTFDRVIFSKGRHFIYSYRKKSYPVPFNLKPLKSSIKKVIPDLYKTDAKYIDRVQLQNILGV